MTRHIGAQRTDFGHRWEIVVKQQTGCANEADISPSTRGSLLLCQIPLDLRRFFAVRTLPCPRVPLPSQDGEEGVNGSSPLEGFIPQDHERSVPSVAYMHCRAPPSEEGLERRRQRWFA